MMAETTESINDKITLRPLPDGKMFHVFFSYRDTEKDTEWVRNVIKILETQYNFICCDHYLDFLPGREIMENMEECIKRSVKTVIVLSKEYFKSDYCKFELKFAVLMQMRQKQHIVIPVEKEFCDIPESLECFTRLDARGDTESWIHRLVSAIEAPVDEIAITQPMLTNRNYSNFETIHKETTNTWYKSENFLIEHFSNALCRQRIEFNPDLIRSLSSTLLVRHRLCINPSWPIFSCCYFLLPIFLYGGIQITATASNGDDRVLGVLLMVFVILFGVLWPVCCFFANRKGQTNMRIILLAANKELMSQNVFMAYKISRMKAKVTSYLVSKSLPDINHRTIEQENTALKYTFSDDEDYPLLGSEDRSTDAEKEVSDLLLEISPEYFMDFTLGKLNKSKDSRHCIGEICMCEYLELKRTDLKNRNDNQNTIDV